MGVVFSMAEAINIALGEAAGTGVNSLADRLSDLSFRRAVVKSFRERHPDIEGFAVRRVLRSEGFLAWLEAGSTEPLEDYVSDVELLSLGVDDDNAAEIGAALGTSIGMVAFARADWIERQLLRYSRQIDETNLHQINLLLDIWNAIESVRDEVSSLRASVDGQNPTLLDVSSAVAATDLRYVQRPAPGGVSRYQHDIFLSYAPNGDVARWVENFFEGDLRRSLADSLGRPVSIYRPPSDCVDAEWSVRVGSELAAAKCLVAVFSRGYFRSPQKMAELRSIRLRSRLYNAMNIVVAVVAHDCIDPNYLPAEYLVGDRRDFKAYAHPFAIEDWAVRVAYGSDRQDLAESLAETILSPPDFAEFPIVTPGDGVSEVFIRRPQL